MLNTAYEVANNIDKTCTSVYIVESLEMWHAILRHLNTNSIKQPNQICLALNLSTSKWDRCQAFLEAKHPKMTFNKLLEWEINLLELIYNDLVDFKNTISRGSKKYYITFVDDYSMFAKVQYLDQRTGWRNVYNAWSTCIKSVGQKD